MNVSTWQKRLLPFLVIVISALAVCFIVFYFIHISNIEKALESSPQFQSSSKVNANQNLTQWNDLRDLESFSITNRYYNARLIIRSRLLMISLSFLTGVVLCFVGSIFILGKFSEDSTTIEGGRENMNLKLASSSPGIILSFFGIVVISISMMSKIELNVSDAPLFMPQTIEESFQKQINTSQHDIDTTKKKKLDDFINKHK